MRLYKGYTVTFKRQKADTKQNRLMNADYLEHYKRIMRRLGEDDDLLEDYQHPELDRMMTYRNWRELKKILTPDERRAIRYYCSFRRGECSCLHKKWIDTIDKSVARIKDYLWLKFNERLAVYDQINNRYWSSLGGFSNFWCPTKARCLLFTKDYQDWLEELCDRSNRKLHRRQFLVVTVDATKRLKFSRE